MDEEPRGILARTGVALGGESKKGKSGAGEFLNLMKEGNIFWRGYGKRGNFDSFTCQEEPEEEKSASLLRGRTPSLKDLLPRG